MSGWLLLGLPGAIYLSGLSASWIAIGLIIGAWLNWKFVAPRLLAYTEIAGDSITIPSFFERRLRDQSHLLRIVAALIILVFFTFYVSSGMVAAGKFFESSFGWTYLNGMLLVAAITLAYTQIGSISEIADGARTVNPDVWNFFAGDGGAQPSSRPSCRRCPASSSSARPRWSRTS